MRDERESALAASWRKRPDALALTAGRRASAMPGARFPRSIGTFPTADELVQHLEEFASHHHIRVRTDFAVKRVDRDGDVWSERGRRA
ncbi:hypothetical protein [Yaniella halotolerans]|uniref:hypothetical protein n=1 Tax=Yaniella halotolerans TaxID=225453 RepID=UPI0003B4DA91|nr:hypothetical protein [Yaniella halotolerans]